MNRSSRKLQLFKIASSFMATDPYMAAEQDCIANGFTDIEAALKELRKLYGFISEEQRFCGPLLQFPQVHEVIDPQFEQIKNTQPESAIISFDSRFLASLPMPTGIEDKKKYMYKNLGRLRSYVRAEAYKIFYKPQIARDGRFNSRGDQDLGLVYYSTRILNTKNTWRLSKLKEETRQYLDQLV